MKVNGQPIWTENYTIQMDMAKMPEWFNAPYVSNQQVIHQASFSGEGDLRISIRVPEQIINARVRPLSRNIKPAVSGNEVSFSIPGPDKLYIEINGLPPLYLFADPVEAEKHSPDDPGMHYFRPGVHHPGYITLKDNETLYIAAGALVYGGIRAENASNIRVLGRGILDGNYEFRRMVRMENCSDILVEGIYMRNSVGWTNTLINCDTLNYRGVKVMGFGPSSDGINPLGSREVEISDCFLRCTDDCIALKNPYPGQEVKNVLVKNNTMYGFAYSDGITIGFETNNPVTNVTVQNCDILMARGGSMVEGHSGFSIICDGPGIISNILFENIRVEKAEEKLFELHITDGTDYGDDPPGHIKDVVVKNVHWMEEGPIILKGFNPDHQVRNVVFENCSVAGNPLKSTKDPYFKIGSFVEGISVR
ncbi:MAG: hypothetical protein K9J30_02650 [Bacteroidales bacterium]|nr:hypothetical protein [Bacteroidales bacterium]